MSNSKLTEIQMNAAVEHLSRLVTEAAMPDREGKRMSALELKTLAEDAAQAISAGAQKLTA